MKLQQAKLSTVGLLLICFALGMIQHYSHLIKTCVFCMMVRWVLAVTSAILLWNIFLKTNLMTSSVQFAFTFYGMLESIPYMLFQTPWSLSPLTYFFVGCKKSVPCHQFPMFGPFNLATWSFLLLGLLVLLSITDIYLIYFSKNISSKR